MNNKFKIGQRVVVVDDGKTYSTYKEMAKLMGLENWKKENKLPNGSEVVIVNVKPHISWSNEILYGIQIDNGKQVIIHEDGLILTTLVKQLPSQWYVRCTNDMDDTPELAEWRKEAMKSVNWNISGIISETGYWKYKDDAKGTEISYDDFLELVYKPWKQSQTIINHPEHWYIQCTPENYNELYGYWSKIDHEHWNLRDYHILLSKHPGDSSAYWSSNESHLNTDHPEYVKITIEQFREITKNKNKNTMKQLDTTQTIKITKEQLFAYYEAATGSQKEYMDEHFKLSGTTTIQGIIGLHEIACSKWKSIIKKNHPECFPEDSKYYDLKSLRRDGGSCIFTQEEAVAAGFDSGGFIQIAEAILNSKYKNKGFYLSDHYNWEFHETDGGGWVVVPTKKGK